MSAKSTCFSLKKNLISWVKGDLNMLTAGSIADIHLRVNQAMLKASCEGFEQEVTAAVKGLQPALPEGVDKLPEGVSWDPSAPGFRAD